MNIVTVSNEGWINSHGVRWVRFARASNPGARLYLLYAGDGDGRDELGLWDEVKFYDKSVACRDWYNVIRMKAGEELGIDEYLYCDLDADILQDLGKVQEQKGDVMWVRSPGVSDEWKAICAERGWKEWGANNGFLYVRKNYASRYVEMLDELKVEGCWPRLIGTYAFNWLVRENKDKFSELPYYNSVIWWDFANFANAKCVQYCNDAGQAKRLELERVWREAVQ